MLFTIHPAFENLQPGLAWPRELSAEYELIQWRPIFHINSQGHVNLVAFQTPLEAPSAFNQRFLILVSLRDCIGLTWFSIAFAMCIPLIYKMQQRSTYCLIWKVSNDNIFMAILNPNEINNFKCWLQKVGNEKGHNFHIVLQNFHLMFLKSSAFVLVNICKTYIYIYI